MSDSARNRHRMKNQQQEHAVLAFLAPHKHMSHDLDWSVDELESVLRTALHQAGVGELDGHEVNMQTGELEFFAYGADADELASVVRGVLQNLCKQSGSYLIKRYGGPGAREERLELR